MSKRYMVIYTHRSVYEGMGMGEEAYEVDRSEHHSYFGADWQRRFGRSYPTMGMRWIETTLQGFDEDATPPWYAGPLEQLLWPVAYWLRNRWDGLRHGLDRDER